MQVLSLWIAWHAGLLPAQPQTELRIVSEVSLVVVDVGVRNRHGQPVSNIPSSAFRAFDEGQLKPIVAFAREDAPVTVGVVVDCSGSMQRKRAELLAAVTALLEESNPKDESFLVTFNDVVRPWPLSQPAEIRKALESTAVEGRTALFDGIMAGLENLAGSTWERKALVVISDGADNASRTSRREIMRQALLAHATIYAIGILDEWEKDRSPGVLREIAGLTGGEAYIDLPAARLTEACRRIAKDIRSRYMIAFSAAQTTREQRRSIRVEVAGPGKTRVSARRSYLALPAARGTEP